MKLFSKIATVLAGFSLALGVGVAATSLGKDFKEANATTGTASIDFTTTDQFVSGTSSQLVYAENPVSITVNKNGSSTAANNAYPGVTNDKGVYYTHTRFYKTQQVVISAGDNYLKPFTFTTESGYADELANATWTDATASYSENTVTVTPGNNKHSVSAVMGSATRVTAASIPWTSEADTTPAVAVDVTSVRVAKDGSNTFNVEYSNLTAALNITSGATGVATVSYTPVASGSGSVEVTVAGVTAGEATITVASTGATSKTVTAIVYNPVTFVEIDNASRLTAGTNIIVVASEYNYVLGQQSANNRYAVAIQKVDNAKGESTVTVDPGVTGILEVGISGDYFTLTDVVDNKYLYAAGSGSNNYLRETTTLDDKAKFNITYSAGVATIVAVDASVNGVMKYNDGSKAFSCYSASSTQKDVTIYMQGNELPAGSNVTSISDVQLANPSIENGETTTLTATYAPTNATEAITVTVSDLSEGNATVGAVAMDSGVLTVEVTATAAGEVMFMLEAAANSISVDSPVLTVLNSLIVYESGNLNKDSVDATVGSANEIADLVWYNTQFEGADGAELFTNDKGMQIGSGSKAVTAFELTSQLFVGTDYASKNAHLIESIIINASIASNGDCDMSVYLDDVQVGTTIALTTTATAYTFNVGAGVGHIRIAFENNAEKAFYLKSIVVRGINDGDNSELYKIAQELELVDSCNVTASEWNAFKAKNNVETASTYEEVIEVYDSEFAAISLYDHASKNPTSLKATSYSALAKYNFIEGELNGGTPSRFVLGIDNNNTMTLVIIVVSAAIVSGFAFFYIIKRRKHN